MLRFFLFLLASSLTFCSKPEKGTSGLKTSDKKKHANIIILVDLSDRLLHEEQPERDKKIIHLIYGEFEKKIKKSVYIQSKDRIMVQIAHQKKSPIEIEKLENEFYQNIDEIPIALRHKNETARKNQFSFALDKLYSQAVFSEKRNDYFGADIEKYFRDDLANDMKKGNYKNYLVVITDGYMFIRGKQSEMAAHLIEVKKTFSNLKVAIVEINPKDIDGEYDRLKVLWKEWLKNMGISDVLILKKDFIKKNLETLSEFLGIP